MKDRYSYWYLHKNGTVIHKPAVVVDTIGPEEYFESDLVVEWWKVGDAHTEPLEFLKELKKRDVKLSRMLSLCGLFNIHPNELGIVYDLNKGKYKYTGGG